LLYQLLVAEIASQRGDLNLTAVNYLRVARATRDPQIAATATSAAVYARAYDLAEEAATLWVDVAPEDIDARQAVAALQIRAKKPAAAQIHLERLVELAPTREQGFQLAANLLARQDRQHALQMMEQLIAPYPQDPDALYAYAELA